MAVYYRQTAHSSGQRLQAGFGVTGLAILVVLMGFLLVPLLRLTASSVGVAQVRETQAALETARDALLAYAAANNGCLPYAADFEGGLPDTDKDVLSQPGYADSGTVRKKENLPTETQDVYAGDLPWAELGLGSDFLDSAGLRIEYYVAKPYLTKLLKPGEVGVLPLTQKDRICRAGFRGFEWDPNVAYSGTDSQPVFVYIDVSDGIAVAQTPVGPGDLALSGALAQNTGVAILDKPARVAVTSTGDDELVTFTIDGEHKRGTAITEVIAGPKNGTVTTTREFKTVTRVAISGAATGSITVGMDGDRKIYPVFYSPLPAGTPPDQGGPDFDPAVTYDPCSNESPIYVFDTPFGTYRQLYMIETCPSLGQDPDLDFKEFTRELLKDPLLEVRRGPDVFNGDATETAVVSSQNVFVLIAPGSNRNADAKIMVTGTRIVSPRSYSRDANHVRNNGIGWLFYEEMADGEIKSKDVDDVIFSATRAVDGTDEGDDGDDTLLVMSFTAFRTEMSKYGLNMEPVCYDVC